MTTGWPSGVTTTVLAERLLMLGAYTAERNQGCRPGNHLAGRRGVNGCDLRFENHLHQAVRPDERRDVQLDADVLIAAVDGRHGGGAVADRGEADAARQIDALADDDLRHLAVARENGRARQHLRLAGGGQGLDGRRKITAENLINPAVAGRPRQGLRQSKVVARVHALVDRRDAGGNNVRLPTWTAGHRIIGHVTGDLRKVFVQAGVVALDADGGRLVVVHLDKDHLDEHLRFGRVEAVEHLLDLLAGLLVGDDDDVVRHRIHRNGRAADRAVVVVLAAAGRGTAVGVVPAAAESAKSAEPTKAAEPPPPAALLGMNGHCGAQKKNQHAAEIFLETVCFHSLPYSLKIFMS